MGYYRVTYERYVEGEYESAEKAKEDFILAVEDEWQDDLSVEEFDFEKEEWK